MAEVRVVTAGLSTGKAAVVGLGRGRGWRPSARARAAMVPPPARASSVISAPHSRASSRAIARPSPLPGGPRSPALPRRKRSNASSRSLAGTPAPRSRISIRAGAAGDRDRRASGRVVQGVLQQGIERPLEIGTIGPGGTGSSVALAARVRSHTARPRDASGPAPRLARSSSSTEVAANGRPPARLSSNSSSTVRDRRSTSPIAAWSSSAAAGPGQLAGLFEPQPQSGQWSAQLV